MIPGALIVTHGELGEVLIQEAVRLVGPQERLIAMATAGLSAEEISLEVRNQINKEPWIVFTDSPGTSPTLRSMAALSAEQALVTGVNLPMLLSFLVHRENLGIKELALRMLTDGKRSLEVKWPPEEMD